MTFGKALIATANTLPNVRYGSKAERLKPSK